KQGFSRKRIIESSFAGRQESDGRFTFTESREVLKIDGKAVPNGTDLPELPAFFGGGFSSVLQMTFGLREIQYQSYRVPYGTADSDGAGSNLFLVEFETKPNQTGLRTLLNSQNYVNRDIGKALVDRESMQVVRLRREFRNIPKDWASYIVDIQYR